MNRFRFIKVRDVKSPSRGNEGDAGLDFYIPEDLTLQDLVKANPQLIFHMKNGEGLHIIQTFEPVPLYPVLALMGFEHHTEKVSGSEYHVWFYRVRKGE